MWLILAMIISCSVVGKGEIKRTCFTPAMCSQGDVTTTDWLEVKPTSQCENKYSGENNQLPVHENQTLDENHIKALVKKETDGLRADVKNLSDSAAIENAKLQTKIEASFGSLNDTTEKNAAETRALVSNLNGSLTEKNAEIQNKTEMLNETMDKRFQDTEKVFDAKLVEIMLALASHEQIVALASTGKTSLITNVLKTKGLCEVQYNNSCFWAIVREEFNVTYTEAERLCNKSGGQVADIYNQQFYNLVVKYLRTKIPSSRNNIYIWIATKYNPITGVATARNGGQAFVSWGHGKLKSGSSYSALTAVYIDIRQEEASNQQGMGNGLAWWTEHGVVCGI